MVNLTIKRLDRLFQYIKTIQICKSIYRYDDLFFYQASAHTLYIIRAQRPASK